MSHNKTGEQLKIEFYLEWFATGQWFSPGSPVSSTKKTNNHDITEILFKVVLKSIIDKGLYYKQQSVNH